MGLRLLTKNQYAAGTPAVKNRESSSFTRSAIAWFALQVNWPSTPQALHHARACRNMPAGWRFRQKSYRGQDSMWNRTTYRFISRTCWCTTGTRKGLRRGPHPSPCWGSFSRKTWPPRRRSFASNISDHHIDSDRVQRSAYSPKRPALPERY
jgi:hypothetical protein